MPTIQDSRILIKSSTTTGIVPTVPSSNDHTDGSWLATDIYKSEMFINVVDGRVFTRDNSGIIEITPGVFAAIILRSTGPLAHRFSVTIDDTGTLNAIDLGV